MASLRAIACLAVPIVTSLPVEAAMAQSGSEAPRCIGVYSTMCRTDSEGDSGPQPLPFGLQPGWLQDLLTTDDAERDANRRAQLQRQYERGRAANNSGLAAFNAGNFEDAVRHFRQARDLIPGNSTVRQNLESAETRVFEAANNQRDTRVLSEANARISGIAEDTARLLANDRAAPTGPALAFGTPEQRGVITVPSGPGTAVDARNIARPAPNLPRLEQVENSPGREAWLRGMDAAARANAGTPREWDLALAWFQTALQRDPTNEALRQAVILAEFTRDAARRRAALPPPVRRMVVDQNAELRLPQDSDLALLFPEVAESPLGPTTEERAREETARSLGVTLPEDEEIVFSSRDYNGDRDNMVGGLSAIDRARLAERGQRISADDWTSRMAPEIRGMVAELREALPPRTYGPRRPDPSPSERMAADGEAIGNAWASDAVVRILYGDLAGAERALDDAARLRPGLGPATELVRRWRGELRGELTGLAPGAEIQRERQ